MQLCVVCLNAPQIIPRKPRAKPMKAAKPDAPPEIRMDRTTLRRVQRDEDGNEPPD
jgi:hypothetical protein